MKIKLCLFKYVAATLILCLLTQDISFAKTMENPGVAQAHLRELDRLSIPNNLGTVDEFFEGTNGKIILFIQDAHDSLEAQENIARLITHFVKRGSQTVFEEGYAGPVPTDAYFGDIKSTDIKRKVSFYYLDHLKLGGAEYAHINRAMYRVPGTEHGAVRTTRYKLPRQEWKLIGADDLSAYKENVNAFADAEKTRAAIEENLHALFRELADIAKIKFSKTAQNWIRDRLRYENNQLDVPNYVLRTLNLFKNSEQQAWPLLWSIKELAAQKETPTELLRGSRPKEILTELTEAEAKLEKRYFQTSEEIQLWHFLRATRRLAKLAELKLSPSDLNQLKAEMSALDTEKLASWIAKEKNAPVVLSKEWESQIRAALRFYELAAIRENAVEKSLEAFVGSDEKSAVLVFGGFHKEGIADMLRKHGFSYQVITPKISEVSLKHQNLYREAMLSTGLQPSATGLAAHAARPPDLFITTPPSVARAEIRELAKFAKTDKSSLPEFSFRAETQLKETGRTDSPKTQIAAAIEARSEMRIPEEIDHSLQNLARKDTVSLGEALLQIGLESTYFATLQHIYGVDFRVVFSDLVRSNYDNETPYYDEIGIWDGIKRLPSDFARFETKMSEAIWNQRRSLGIPVLIVAILANLSGSFSWFGVVIPVIVALILLPGLLGSERSLHKDFKYLKFCFTRFVELIFEKHYDNFVRTLSRNDMEPRKYLETYLYYFDLFHGGDSDFNRIYEKVAAKPPENFQKFQEKIKEIVASYRSEMRNPEQLADQMLAKYPSVADVANWLKVPGDETLYDYWPRLFEHTKRMLLNHEWGQFESLAEEKAVFKIIGARLRTQWKQQGLEKRFGYLGPILNYAAVYEYAPGSEYLKMLSRIDFMTAGEDIERLHTLAARGLILSNHLRHYGFHGEFLPDEPAKHSFENEMNQRIQEHHLRTTPHSRTLSPGFDGSLASQVKTGQIVLIDQDFLVETQHEYLKLLWQFKGKLNSPITIEGSTLSEYEWLEVSLIAMSDLYNHLPSTVLFEPQGKTLGEQEFNDWMKSMHGIQNFYQRNRPFFSIPNFTSDNPLGMEPPTREITANQLEEVNRLNFSEIESVIRRTYMPRDEDEAFPKPAEISALMTEAMHVLKKSAAFDFGPMRQFGHGQTRLDGPNFYFYGFKQKKLAPDKIYPNTPLAWRLALQKMTGAQGALFQGDYLFSHEWLANSLDAILKNRSEMRAENNKPSIFSIFHPWHAWYSLAWTAAAGKWMFYLEGLRKEFVKNNSASPDWLGRVPDIAITVFALNFLVFFLTELFVTKGTELQNNHQEKVVLCFVFGAFMLVVLGEFLIPPPLNYFDWKDVGAYGIGLVSTLAVRDMGMARVVKKIFFKERKVTRSEMREQALNAVVAEQYGHNQSMYGSKSYEFHIQQSARALTKAVDAAPAGGSALIIGLGSGRGERDVLEKIAKKFDEIVVQDIDEVTARETIKRLPAKLQSKFKLQVRDASNSLERISQKVEDLIAESPSLEILKPKLIDFLESFRFDVVGQPQPEKYQFVSSSLVASQLGFNVDFYLRARLAMTYPSNQALNMMGNDMSFLIAMSDFLVRQHEAHIQTLGKLVQDDGVVYFADTAAQQTHGILQVGKNEFVPMRGQVEANTDLKRLENQIAQTFPSSQKPDQWTLTTMEPTLSKGSIRMDGKDFLVAAWLLRKRSEARKKIVKQAAYVPAKSYLALLKKMKATTASDKGIRWDKEKKEIVVELLHDVAAQLGLTAQQLKASHLQNQNIKMAGLEGVRNWLKKTYPEIKLPLAFIRFKASLGIEHDEMHLATGRAVVEWVQKINDFEKVLTAIGMTSRQYSQTDFSKQALNAEQERKLFDAVTAGNRAAVDAAMAVYLHVAERSAYVFWQDHQERVSLEKVQEQGSLLLERLITLYPRKKRNYKGFANYASKELRISKFPAWLRNLPDEDSMEDPVSSAPGDYRTMGDSVSESDGRVKQKALSAASEVIDVVMDVARRNFDSKTTKPLFDWLHGKTVQPVTFEAVKALINDRLVGLLADADGEWSAKKNLWNALSAVHEFMTEQELFLPEKDMALTPVKKAKRVFSYTLFEEQIGAIKKGTRKSLQVNAAGRLPRGLSEDVLLALPQTLRRIYELAIGGATYDAIAKQTGKDDVTVFNAVAKRLPKELEEQKTGWQRLADAVYSDVETVEKHFSKLNATQRRALAFYYGIGVQRRDYLAEIIKEINFEKKPQPEPALVQLLQNAETKLAVLIQQEKTEVQKRNPEGREAEVVSEDVLRALLPDQRKAYEMAGGGSHLSDIAAALKITSSAVSVKLKNTRAQVAAGYTGWDLLLKDLNWDLSQLEGLKKAFEDLTENERLFLEVRYGIHVQRQTLAVTIEGLRARGVIQGQKRPDLFYNKYKNDIFFKLIQLLNPHNAAGRATKAQTADIFLQLTPQFIAALPAIEKRVAQAAQLLFQNDKAATNAAIAARAKLKETVVASSIPRIRTKITLAGQEKAKGTSGDNGEITAQEKSSGRRGPQADYTEVEQASEALIGKLPENARDLAKVIRTLTKPYPPASEIAALANLKTGQFNNNLYDLKRQLRVLKVTETGRPALTRAKQNKAAAILNAIPDSELNLNSMQARGLNPLILEMTGESLDKPFLNFSDFLDFFGRKPARAVRPAAVLKGEARSEAREEPDFGIVDANLEKLREAIGQIISRPNISLEEAAVSTDERLGDLPFWIKTLSKLKAQWQASGIDEDQKFTVSILANSEIDSLMMHLAGHGYAPQNLFMLQAWIDGLTQFMGKTFPHDACCISNWPWELGLSARGGKLNIRYLLGHFIQLSQRIHDDYGQAEQEIILEAVYLARIGSDKEQARKQATLQRIAKLAPHLKDLADWMIANPYLREREWHSVADHKILWRYFEGRIGSHDETKYHDHSALIAEDKRPLLIALRSEMRTDEQSSGEMQSHLMVESRVVLSTDSLFTARSEQRMLNQTAQKELGGTVLISQAELAALSKTSYEAFYKYMYTQPELKLVVYGESNAAERQLQDLRSIPGGMQRVRILGSETLALQAVTKMRAVMLESQDIQRNQKLPPNIRRASTKDELTLGLGLVFAMTGDTRIQADKNGWLISTDFFISEIREFLLEHVFASAA